MTGQRCTSASSTAPSQHTPGRAGTERATERAPESALPVNSWRSACGPDGGNCVEVNLAAREATGIVGIRDSKPGAGPALVFGATGWGTFLAATVADNYASDNYRA